MIGKVGSNKKGRVFDPFVNGLQVNVLTHAYREMGWGGGVVPPPKLLSV